MSLKYFLEFVADMALAGLLAVAITCWVGAIIICLEWVWRALTWSQPKAKNNSSARKKDADDDDRDGGVGGAPVCP